MNPSGCDPHVKRERETDRETRVVNALWYAVGESADDGWTVFERYAGTKDTVFWHIAASRWVISQLNGRTDMNPDRNMKESRITQALGMAVKRSRGRKSQAVDAELLRLPEVLASRLSDLSGSGGGARRDVEESTAAA